MKAIYICLFGSLLLASLQIVAHSEQPFTTRVVAMDCQEDRNVRNLDSTCFVTVREDDSSESPEIGIVLHYDFYFSSGIFISEGSRVVVDLGYTEKLGDEGKSLFPDSVTSFYFHDVANSFGGYADVISPIRR